MESWGRRSCSLSQALDLYHLNCSKDRIVYLSNEQELQSSIVALIQGVSGDARSCDDNDSPDHRERGDHVIAVWGCRRSWSKLSNHLWWIVWWFGYDIWHWVGVIWSHHFGDKRYSVTPPQHEEVLFRCGTLGRGDIVRSRHFGVRRRLVMPSMPFWHHEASGHVSVNCAWYLCLSQLSWGRHAWFILAYTEVFASWRQEVLVNMEGGWQKSTFV